MTAAQTQEIRVKVTADTREVPKEMRAATTAVRNARKQIEAVTAKLPKRGTALLGADVKTVIQQARGIASAAAGAAGTSSAEWQRYRRIVLSELEAVQRKAAQTQAQLDKLRPQVFTRDSGDADDFVKMSLAAGWSDEQIEAGLAEKEAAASTTKAGQAYTAAQVQLRQYTAAIEQATGRLQGLNAQVDASRGAEAAARRQAQAAREAAQVARQAAAQQARAAREQAKAVRVAAAEQARAAKQAAVAQARAARQQAVQQARAAKRSAMQGRVALGSLTGIPASAGLGIFAVLGLASALGTLGKSLFDAALKNDEFRKSVAQIRGNLSVAFQAVYQAVLPALQAFARWLATATNYFAQFMAVVFNVKYEIAAAGAQDEADAIDGITGAAKKAKRAMAGFDEINILSFQSGGGGGGGGSSGGLPDPEVGPPIPLPTWLQDAIDKFKEWGGIIRDNVQPALDSLKDIWEKFTGLLGGGEGGGGSWWIDTFFPALGTYITNTALLEIGNILTDLSGLGQILEGIFTLDPTKILNGFKDLAVGVWSMPIDMLANLGDLIGNLFGVDLGLVEGFQKIKQAVLDFDMQVVIDWFGDAWDAVVEVWSSVGSWFGERWTDIKNAFGSVWTWFKDKFASGKEGIAAGFSGVATWFSDRWTDIKNAFGSVWTWFKDKFVSAKQGLIAGFSGAVKWFQERWTDIKNAFGSVWTWFKDKFVSAKQGLIAGFSGAVKWFQERWTDIKNAFGSVWTWFRDKFASGKEGIAAGFTGIGKWFGDRWTDIKNAFGSVWTWFNEKFSAGWSAIKDAFSLTSIGTFFSDVWTTIKGKFTDVGTSIGNAVSGAFKTAVNSVFATIERLVNGFIDSINRIIDVYNSMPFPDIGKIGKISLPRLATGGIVTSPVLAMMGEQHKKEAVLPLDRNTGWMDTLAQRINSTNGGGGGDGTPIIIMLDGEIVYRSTVNRANQDQRRTGQSPVLA